MKYFANNSPLAVRKGAWLLVSCLVLVQLQGTAQKPTPAPPQSKSILLKGGTLHVGNGITAMRKIAPELGLVGNIQQ